jgi:hypothetical protein
MQVSRINTSMQRKGTTTRVMLLIITSTTEIRLP